MPHLTIATLGAAFLATVPAHASRAERYARPLAAALSGRCAAPAPGDPGGRGTARISLDLVNGEVCFELDVSGIAPATAAWIHEGHECSPGRGVITLMPPVGGRSGGCVLAERSAIRELLKDPARYYVAVRNADFPGDALRGQLSR
jgi:hypothetical protein